MAFQYPPLTVAKHPYAVQREFVDWSLYRKKLPAGATLSSVTPVAPAGISAVAGPIIGDVSQVVISDGMAGEDYALVLRCDWSNGDTDDRTVTVQVRSPLLVAPGPVAFDPDADEFHGIDWSPLIAKIGGAPTIGASSWPAVAGIAIDNASIVGSIAQAHFSLPTAGVDIVVENRVDLSNGDKDARNILFRVADQ